MSKGSTLGRAPSVEFFFNDWHGGTAILSRHQKGCFMDLLHAQFNNGHLSIEAIKNVLGNDFAAWQGVLSKKFVQDEQGLYYNRRLDFQIQKKVSYSNSRNKNLTSNGEHHMGYGNGLVKDLEERKAVFKNEVWFFETDYPKEMLQEFFEYWSEANKSRTKMLFETKKTFEIPKRLSFWARNNKTFTGKVVSKSGFPDYWSKEYEIKLPIADRSKYWQHLHSLGWKPRKNQVGEVIEWRKEQAA